MKKISSKYTYFYKVVFPVFWFGFLTIFLVIGVVGGAAEESPMFLIVPIAMGIFGYFLMKKIVWDLMDEVIDHGDYLTVKYRGKVDTVNLENIMNVSETTNQNPSRITLRLRSRGKFGDEISFSPVSEFSINPFKKSSVGEDLIQRVDRARR